MSDQADLNAKATAGRLAKRRHKRVVVPPVVAPARVHEEYASREARAALLRANVPTFRVRLAPDEGHTYVLNNEGNRWLLGNWPLNTDHVFVRPSDPGIEVHDSFAYFEFDWTGFRLDFGVWIPVKGKEVTT